MFQLLLKNPRQQISYLNLVDDITPECDIQLVTSTFPSLTKLVLSRITKMDGMSLSFSVLFIELYFYLREYFNPNNLEDFSNYMSEKSFSIINHCELVVELYLCNNFSETHYLRNYSFTWF